jgi:GNAT superfamily N-acetyltransferase/transposase-like protein
MAELYDQKKIYAKLPTAQPAEGVDGELEAMLAELPPEERDAARQYITAAPTGEDVYKAMQEKNANGEVFNMNLDQYRLYKSYIKNKETDIIETMGQAAGGVFDEIMKAGGSIADDPTGALAKFTPSLIEAFAQGTRSLYGMAAQSQDPTSVFFRVKNALSANGDDEAAEFQQFMDAQAFNVHSMRLATGQDTLVMDKDVINPEMTQVMSYIADPTLFVPFGGIAAKGARLVGMGEGLAKASARAAQIQNKILGGTLKWGVGAPIEFLGTATRNTIDFGLEKAGMAFETVTGMPAAEARTTAQMYGWYSASAALEGRAVALPVFGDIAGAMVGSTTARGVGESISMIGEQMLKQQKHGRGVLSYAGQALRDAEKSGVPLSKHAKALLNVIDKADPLFVYSADLAKGAGEGMAIGAGLGYLSAGEEGAASGAGAGLALGTVGAGLGSIVSDIGNGRLYDRIAVQRQMVIEGLRQVDPAKASAFEALVAAVETTGNRDYIAQTDGIIAGIDLAAPNAKFNIRSTQEHINWLRSQNIDPDTGRLSEPSAILPEFGGDRKSRGKVLSFLGMANERFKSKDELLGFLKTVPQDHALRREFFRLDDKQKQVVFDTIGKHQDAEYRKQFGNKSAGEFYKDLNYGEANVARVNAMFDSGNKTRANEMIRQMLKDETVNGQLTERGKLLKEKLATEGYFDKDGNMRPSRLKDVELTAEAYANSAGFVVRRDSTGQVEININLDAFGRDTVPHELFHAIMLESAFKPDFTDRLTQNLLGKFDANGKMIERPSVDTNQVKKFFARYIDALHGRNPEERDNQIKRLDAAIKEYESRGTTNKISEAGNDSLETMVEEFGAYYFGKFINDKPVDFLFRGGELGAMREMLGNAKQGWLDFWRSKIKGQNPTLDFDNIQGTMITTGFGKNGVRARVTALDLFMRDFVRATAMANKQGGFDVSRLSPEAQKTFIKNQGIRVYGNPDANGRVGRKSQRQIISEQIKTGKEIYKILSGLDPELRKGLTIDGEGNLSGRLSPEAMEAMVQSGHIDRAWVDKIQNAYNILDGKGSNVINFGYLGRTAQIGDYAWPRLVGNAVPFKNRAAVLLDVDFKVGKDGKMSALFHTLDKAVIDGRADVLWSDSVIRQLWDNDRAAMEADFFRYLSNASLPSSDPNRVPSARLLEDGTGKGAMRRNALHQMLGMVKPEGDVYLNKPIAEIPYGIRHSVTTFSVDGISNMRVASGGRWDIVPQNAFRDLARNFQPSEMTREQTPKGAIIKHASGFKFSESGNKVVAYTSAGRKIGIYDNIHSASAAAKNEYNKVYDNIEKGTQDSVREQDKIATKFQPLEKSERDEAVRLGDVFALPSMRAFVGDRTLLRQTREEHIYQRALEASKNPEQLLALAEQVSQRNQQVDAEYKRLKKELNTMENTLQGEVSSFEANYYKTLNNLKDVKYGVPTTYEDWKFDQLNKGKWNPPERWLDSGKTNPEWTKYNSEGWDRYQEDAKSSFAKMSADPEYIASQESYNKFNEYRKQKNNELLDFRHSIEEFRNKNAEALDDPILEQLNSALLENTTREEKANMFAGLVEASAKTKDYSGLLEAMFAGEYDSQIQTGKPFVAVTTHGTGSVELMLSRLFAADKLGSHYDIPSSRMGSFSAGSQNTSKSYARVNNTFKGTPLYKTSKLVLDYASGKDIKVGTSAINFLSAHTDFFREYKKAYEADYVRLNEEAKQYMSSIDRDEYFNELKNEILDLTIGQIEYRISKKQDSKGAVSALAKMQLHFEEIFGKQNNAPMQLRKVIRMDNPYVVVDPRSYEEHYISPHMKRAMEAGHDGIVFKRFADGGERDNVYVVFKDFMKDNIKVIDTSFDDAGVPRGTDNYGRVLKGGKELGLKFQPTERDAGGRVYDQNSDEFKSGFIGLWASKNPEKLKGKNIQFFQKEDGSYRIRMQDNSSGKTKNVGHITASISDTTATLSSNIDPEFRGNKLSYALYSEMAERLRAMGIERVDGQIVNKDGVPIKVREQVIGDTRDYFSGKPISQEEGARRIQERQEQVGSMGGVDVYNRLDPKARYQPAEEGGRTYTQEQFKTKFIGRVADENPELTKNLSIKVLGDKSSFEFYIYDKNFSETTPIGEISTINKSSNKKDNIITKAYLKPEYRGKGFGKLLYSELGERLRSVGIENIEGTVTDLQNRPFSIRASVFGKDSTSRMVGTKDGVTTRLDKNARYQPAEDVGITPTEGFRWYKRSKYNNIPREREIMLDKVLTDVFENKMSYAEAAKANNYDRLLVAKLVKNYVKNNPSATPLTPSEAIKNHKFKWYVPDEKANAYSLSEAIRIDEAMNDVISKSMLIQDSAKKHSLSVDVITYAIKNARERGSQFPAQLGGVGSNTRSKELYAVNNETGRMKISEENRKAIQSMYFDEGYSQKEVASFFGISKAIVQDILKETGSSRRMQPAEGEQGGRTYTDEQFNKEFIGKYASENPELADKFIIRIKTNDGEGYEDYDYKMVIYDKETKKPVARTKWQLFENEDGILEDAAADVEILNDAYKGMKLSHLMQSERLERSRFLGAEKVRAQITNEEGIPIKNYAKTIGADKGEITSAFSDRVDEQGMVGYVPATMENFKQEMDLSKQHADNTWKPAVYYRAKLDPKARYQPSEYQGGDDYWKPKKNIFEYKDEEGLLVRRPFVGNDEITGDKNARGYLSNPADYNLDWTDIGHYPQIRKTKELNRWEIENSGLWVDDINKGILTKNPASTSDNTGYTHSEWFETYQYDEDKPPVYGRYEKPRYDSKGKLLERGKFSITSRYSDHFSSMSEVYEYKNKIAKKLGVNPEDVDAFYFGANSELKKQLGYGSRDNLPIKFQPKESSIIGIDEIAEAKRIGNLFKTKGMQEFVGDREIVPQTADEGFIDFIKNFKEADINQDAALMILEEMSKGMFGGLDRQVKRIRLQELNEKATANFEKSNPKMKGLYKELPDNRLKEYLPLSEYVEYKKLDEDLSKQAPKNQQHSEFTASTAKNFAKKIEDAKKWVKKANPQYNDFAGYIAENVPMREYYQHAVYSKKFKTGQPVAVVGVHGTNTSQGFLKEKKYRPVLREDNVPLSEGEVRGAYWASSDETVLSKEYQGGYLESMGYEVKDDKHRAESDLPNIAKSVIRFDNPLVVDGQFTPIMKRTEKILGEAIQQGHDGVIYINQMDGGNLDISFIVPADKANQHQRMIGSTREKNIEGSSYEPLPRGDGLTNRTAHLQPAEGFRDWKAEQTTAGSLIKNSAGFVISRIGSKYRVYNPYKAVIGVFDNEEQAKRRVQREEPKR